MKRTYGMRPIRCALLSFALAVATASAANLRVKLGLAPVETLPGVPVSVDLTVSNLSTKDIAISNRVLFAATAADGGTNRLSVLLPRQYWSGEMETSGKYVVPAGGEIHLFMPITEDFDSPLFTQETLNRPGEYDLVATVQGTGGSGADSNRVHLQVMTLTGADETIWNMLSDERFTSIDVRASCATTIRKYPQSRYYQLVSPFCVPFVTLDQYSHDVMQGSAALPGPFQDAARFTITTRYLHEAETAYGQNKFALAGTISAAGQPVAQDLLDHPGSSFGTVAGAYSKRQLLNESGWKSRFDRVWAPTADLNVLPAVTCVIDNGDGTFSADFGFNNPNNFDIEVAIGPDNHLSPGPDDQGQPKAFAPGAKDSVFTVTGLTAVATWTLQGKTVKASVGQSPKCADVKPAEPQP